MIIWIIYGGQNNQCAREKGICRLAFCRLMLTICIDTIEKENQESVDYNDCLLMFTKYKFIQ